MPDVSLQPAGLADWLSYLERLHPKAIALGLERVNSVKSRLELTPDFPIFTVTGTNGKGSTCALLEAMLTIAGYQVGCYTSPHLLRYNERIRINRQQVTDAALCEAFAAVEQARQDTPLTYFEFGTLAAVWLFVRQGLQAAILEVGLGGRLDAVNAFDADCAIVTGVDIDHTDYLGDTRESIGWEKAGIFRAGRPALCGDEAPPASLLAYANQIDADRRCIGTEFGFEWRENTSGWRFYDCYGELRDLPLPVLPGRFQLNNAACALAALRSLSPRLVVHEEAMRRALTDVRLAGRFQRLSERPLIVADVAHNPQAARGLAANLQHLPCRGKTLAVFAMLSDKDIGGVVAALAEHFSAWYLAGIDQPRGCSLAALQQQVKAVLPQAALHGHASVAGALAQACRDAGENDRIIVFGSFYTVADALLSLQTIDPHFTGCVVR